MFSKEICLYLGIGVGTAAWSFQNLSAATSYDTPSCLLYGAIATVASSVSILLLLVALTIPASPFDTVGKVLLRLFVTNQCYRKGNDFVRRVQRSWLTPKASQEEFLMRVLRANDDTEYGRQFGLRDMKTVDDFRKRHPLITYAEYKPYVERAMAGEDNVLTRQRPQGFVQTSGTTGPSKFFAHLDHRATMTDWLQLDRAILHGMCPQLKLHQKVFVHYVLPPVSRAASGGQISPGFTLYEDDIMRNCFTTPVAGFRINSYNDANYVHLVFALLDPNIGIFNFVFLGNLDSLMRQLELWWPDIVHDIEHGTINEKVTLDADIRHSLTQALGSGHPERALELRHQFEQGFDGIMKRLWPKLAIIMAVDNSAIWSKLKEKYAKGIQMAGKGYGNSEGMILGSCPWMMDDGSERGYSFVLGNNLAFFEFIKFDDTGKDQPKTLLIDELEVGEAYEIVISQASGLYRYRMGDVLRVSGYHYNNPIFDFMYRLGLILNLRYEKMDQSTVKEALQGAVGRWPGVALVEYAVAESLIIPETGSPAYEKDEIMPYYLVFLEIANSSVEYRSVSGDEKAMIDEELRSQNAYYERLRREGAISHPRVHIVKPGTFDDVKQYVVSNTNTTINQYKVQHKVRTVKMLNFMLDHVIVAP